MAHKLAEETLAEILGYSLNVPDADFASLAELSTSPFVNRQTSSSTALLVCKRWMRIGTPLIYSTAILRSTAQADALALALKANPTFAPYLRKLRIEGGFGVAVRRILEMAPGVSDIWLMLNYTSEDKTKPMCAALEKMASVRRLIIYSSRMVSFANNASTRLVMSTVLHGIMSWPSLRIVQLRGDTALIEPLRKTLLSSKQVEEWRFPEDSYHLPAFVQECPATVKRIRVAWPDPGDGYFRDKRGSFYICEKERLPADQLAKVIFAAPVQIMCIAPPPNPFYKPMKDTPADVRRKIWARVLELLVEEFDCSKGRRYEVWGEMRFGVRQHCMLVSSEFKDVMLELSCRNVKLDGLSAVQGFVTCLQKNPHLAPLVRSLDLREECSRMLYTPSPHLNECFDLVLSCLPALINLRSFSARFHDYPLQLKHLASLAPITETLHELQLHLGATHDDDHYLLSWSPPPPPVDYQLHAFASLRRISLMIGRGAANHLTPPPPHALNALETLHLEGEGCAEFLRLICPLRLDSLRALKVAEVWSADAALEDFCATHGQKLRALSIHQKSIPSLLKHCLNIEILIYPDDGKVNFHRHPNPEVYTAAPLCPRLKAISYSAIDLHHYGRGDKKRVQEVIGAWTAFFDFIVRTPNFPALEVVMVANRYKLWPTTEKEIAKSPLPGWAETLLGRGIRLVDANGAGWTPRLKTQRKGKH